MTKWECIEHLGGGGGGGGGGGACTPIPGLNKVTLYNACNSVIYYCIQAQESFGGESL